MILLNHEKGSAGMSLNIKVRQNGYVTVVELSGRLTLGDATNTLRDSVRELAKEGHNKLLLSLAGVPYIDSAGLGELIGCYTTITRRGGQFKLMGLTGRVADLLQLTKLATVFEIFESETIAVVSYD